MKTIYGEITDEIYNEFCEVAGHKYINGECSVIADELEYWQLSEAASSLEDRRWKKKLGYLTVRDFNFQYAMYQHPKYVKGATGKDVKTFDLEKATKYAKEKLFNGNIPVYLPELLADKADPMRDDSKKPPKGYLRILTEQQEAW